MTINALDREINVYLIQNMGNGTFGSVKDISANLTDISDLGWMADGEITKVSVSSCSFKAVDLDGSLRSFLASNLEIANGLLPPFVMVTLGGEPKYYGVVDPRNITDLISSKESNITIGSQDWFSMVSRIELQGDFWVRQNAVNGVSRPASSVRQGKSQDKLWIKAVYQGQGDPTSLNKVLFPSPNNFFQLGDQFSSTLMAGTFTCVAISEIDDNGTKWVVANLSGFKWPNPDQYLLYYFTHRENFTANFTRLSAETTEQTYYTVAEAVAASEELKPNYRIKLDTTVGIVPGDKLDLRSDLSRANGTTVTILDIDPERSIVITLEPIDKTMAIGDKLYFNSESLGQLVFDDFRNIVTKANSISGTDFSRFTSAQLSEDCLSFLPFTPNGGSTIYTPFDAQPTLTGLEVKGMGGVWAGSPETSWTKQADWTKKVIWTDQRLTAPTLLMPDESASLAPKAPKRNRSLMDWKLRNVDLDADSNDVYISLCTVVHDYSALRRWVFTRNGSTVSIQNAVWNGSTWTTGATQTWAGASPQSMIPFKDVPSSLGSGYSLLCLDAGGTLSIKYGTSTGSLALTGELLQGVLKQTPQGAYLVTKTGYGRIQFAAGQLTLNYVAIPMDREITLIPSTFCSSASGRIYIMAGSKYVSLEDNKTINETYLFELTGSPDPIHPELAVQSFELIFAGIPIIAMSFRDPVKNRIIGILGGRLFQISNEMATTIERYSAEGLNAAQLIENVCMIQNAIIVPSPTGTLRIVSRYNSEAATNITIDQVSFTSNRLSEKFYSQVNVSGSDETIFASAFGMEGGSTFEMEDHPFITTTSQARAIAVSYISFFGSMRKMETQEWAWQAGGRAPWEDLQPMQKITINGDPKEWYVVGVTYSLKKPSAKVTLLEV